MRTIRRHPRATAPRAASSQDGIRGTINVETIGGTLMVQHYHEVSAKPTRVEMLSKRTRGYVFHLIPTHFQVRWTMAATPRTANTTTLRCTVEVKMPALLRLAAASIFTPYFLRKRVEEETPLFAADITRKLVARSLSRMPSRRVVASSKP